LNLFLDFFVRSIKETDRGGDKKRNPKLKELKFDY